MTKKDSFKPRKMTKKEGEEFEDYIRSVEHAEDI